MTNAVPVMVPVGTVGDETVRVLAWLVASGERVDEGQFLVEVETSKATLEVYAPSAGYVWCRAGLSDEVPVGEAICFITQEPEPPTPVPQPRPAAEALDQSRLHARMSPLAARLADASGLSPADFESGSLVRSRDVLAMAKRSARAPSAAATAPVSHAGVSGVPLRWETLPRRKRAEARLLAHGRSACVPSAVTIAYPVSELRAKVAEREPGASATAPIIFEAARLLRQYPLFNSVYSDGRAGLYEEVNIGWALDDGDGLAVPVVRNADRKSVAEIEAEVRNFAAAYVRDRLSGKEFAGATFTISDLSAEGVSVFLPLISRGQSAVLGLGDSTLTLAFDHQLSEGRAAARFLKDLAARLNAHAGDAPAAQRYELCCSFCGHTATELKASKAFLLRCELPARGYVCSLCISYY